MWKKKKDDSDDLAIRRILEAASSDETSDQPPPFFAARVRAQAEQLKVSSAHPVGLAAANALPYLGLAVLCLGVWTAYETTEAADEARAALSSAFSSPERLDEALVIAMLADARRGGSD